jgi:hypothetical protein
MWHQAKPVSDNLSNEIVITTPAVRKIVSDLHFSANLLYGTNMRCILAVKRMNLRIQKGIPGIDSYSSGDVPEAEAFLRR